MPLLLSVSISSPSLTSMQLKPSLHFRNKQRMQLSIAHKAEKEEARDMLQIILSSVRFLARQGLALRGDGSDVSSNLTQLLHVRAEGNPNATVHA